MPFDPTALLKHKDFVRAVAGSLLDDPHLVDDVEQETWALALDRPPRSQGALAAWLGKVARHLAFRHLRSRERRGRREQASAPPRPLTSPDEMAEALETQQRLVAAVLRLDRLYREVILLRFYEGLKPREAAARLHVPVDTVRTRTRRALELLRADLQRDDRRAWFLGLLPLLTPRRAALGAMLMKAKLAAVAALLVLSAVVAWQLAPRAETPRAEPARTAAEAPPEAPRMCRLTGRVADGSGAPVAGARVELRDLEVVTDAQGAFALETAREGPDVLAASSGALRAQQVVELKHGETSAGTLVLAETVTVTGVVLDPGGEGASGAVVEAWPRVVENDLLADDPLAWTGPPPAVGASTLSGEGGAFRLPLPRGSAMVLRARKGAAMTREEVGYDLHEDTGLVVLRLRPVGALRGRVVDLAGAPVAGASVELVPPRLTWGRQGMSDIRSVRGLRTTTEADGSFALLAPSDVYAVLVTHPGHVPFHASRILAPREGWTIRLSPGRALEGVVDAGGRPAPGVRVRIVPTDGHAAPQETTTGEGGRFVFAHAALELPFHLFADGGKLGTALVRDVAWRGEPLRVALDPVADVVGRVVLEDGTAVAGVRLQTWEFIVQTATTASLRGYREATSGDDGRFRLEGASRCRAVWLHPAEARYVAKGRNDIPADGTEVVLTVTPLRRLTVEVEDGDGAPVAGAAVHGRAFTGDDGRCRLFAPAYDTELVATKPGLRGVGTIPKESDEMKIVVRPVPVLRGTVRDAAGNALADVRVQATYTERISAKETSGGTCGTAFTDAEGAFVLDVADAELRVTFERTGFLPAIETMRADGEPRGVVLSASLSLAGRVLDEEGNPIAGVAVASRRVAAWSQVTWTAADGRFVLEDFEPGGWLALSAPGYASRDMVQTDPKARGEQPFVLPRELAIEGRVLKGDGTPAYPVSVYAVAETAPGPFQGAQTDAEGKFRLPALSAGRYTLRVDTSYRFEGLADAEWEPMAGVAAGTTGVVLRPKEPKFLAGTVTDENDRPLRGARVNLYDGATGDFVKGDEVDADGRFRIAVPAGKYELRVNLAGMAFKKFRGVDGGREDIVLRFTPGQEITGQIGSPEGYAPGSGSVDVSSDDFHGYAEVDRSGGFAIRGLPPGTYELTGVGAARGGRQAMRGTARAAAGAAGVRIELVPIEPR